MKIICSFLSLVALLASHGFAEERPNIVFILTDDMGYGDVGCNGGTFVPTPNIDALAHDGIRFTQYTSASPIYSPSRASCTTGQFPARWKITSYLQTREGNRACEQADFLDAKAPSLARTLKAAGYPKGRDRSPNLAVRDGRWKLLIQADGSGEELYDLAADLNETRNVAAEQPGEVQRLRVSVLRWRQGLP